jgi:DNA processing protein
MNQRIKEWIKLSQIKELGLARTLKLVNMFGDPTEFIADGSSKLKDVSFLSPGLIDQITSDKDPENWSLICDLIARYEINFVSILDTEYPEALKSIYNPPLFLFYRGNWQVTAKARKLAIVGTRKPDNYGIMMTRQITEKLVGEGFTIVSGLAYGIDTHAHSATVENGGETIAVMATGCEQIYPYKNRILAERIMEKGVIVSEFIPGTKPEKWNFPLRNRIISGLSLGTFVVQGLISSGALLTAKFALDQNRDLFALPGDINRRESEGPNYLIKLGAKIVTSPADILEEYDLYLFPDNKETPSLTDKEKKILEVVRDNKPSTNYDQLVIQTGLSIGELSAVLLSLEMKNLIIVGNGNSISARD